jgi:hypothetical protein
MPSTSLAQHRFMEMIAHGGKPSGGDGPSASVAKDFVAADKGKNLKRLPEHAKKAQRKALESM